MRKSVSARDLLEPSQCNRRREDGNNSQADVEQINIPEHSNKLYHNIDQLIVNILQNESETCNSSSLCHLHILLSSLC
jgi:hypothetical protein